MEALFVSTFAAARGAKVAHRLPLRAARRTAVLLFAALAAYVVAG